MSKHAATSIMKKGISIKGLMSPRLKSFILDDDIIVKAAVDQRGTEHSVEAEPSSSSVNPITTEVKWNETAQRLTSPIRMCQYTRVRLPSAFLIPLTLVPHPELPEAWILPDFSRTGKGQRRYILNSRKVLELMGKGAWKRLNFRGTQPVVFEEDLADMAKKRVWRRDMIRYVEQDMVRFASGMTLGP